MRRLMMARAYAHVSLTRMHVKKVSEDIGGWDLASAKVMAKHPDLGLCWIGSFILGVGAFDIHFPVEDVRLCTEAERKKYIKAAFGRTFGPNFKLVESDFHLKLPSRVEAENYTRGPSGHVARIPDLPSPVINCPGCQKPQPVRTGLRFALCDECLWKDEREYPRDPIGTHYLSDDQFINLRDAGCAKVILDTPEVGLYRMDGVLTVHLPVLGAVQIFPVK